MLNTLGLVSGILPSLHSCLLCNSEHFLFAEELCAGSSLKAVFSAEYRYLMYWNWTCSPCDLPSTSENTTKCPWLSQFIWAHVLVVIYQKLLMHALLQRLHEEKFNKKLLVQVQMYLILSEHAQSQWLTRHQPHPDNCERIFLSKADGKP